MLALVSIDRSSSSHELIPMIRHLYKHTRGCRSHPYSHIHNFFSSHLISSHLIHSMFATRHRSSPATSTRYVQAKEKQYAGRNPVNAMYIKSSQPTKRAFPAEETRNESENQSTPVRLQMHVKAKQHIHLCERDVSDLLNLSRSTRALVIKAFR